MAKALTLSTRIDRDKLAMLSRDRVAFDAQAVFDPVQRHSPERQIAAMAVAFAVVSERAAMDPWELYALGKKLLHHQDRFHKKGNDTMEALRDFAAFRIKTLD